jgi:hypothetical protein
MSQYPVDSPFERHTLDEKARYINKNSILSLVLAIFSFLFCGFIGFYSFSLSSSVVETVDYYNICHDRRPIAFAAKIISLVAAALWVLGVVFWLLYGTGLHGMFRRPF